MRNVNNSNAFVNNRNASSLELAQNNTDYSNVCKGANTDYRETVPPYVFMKRMVVLGHNAALVRLYWAGDNLGECALL